MCKIEQIGTSIGNLPDHILEEIFSFVQDRTILRLVSKRFKNVMDNSSRLMKKYALNVSKFDSRRNMFQNYEALKFTKLRSKEINFVTNYSHKYKIKYINIDAQCNKGIGILMPMLQYIVVGFDNLREIVMNLKEEYFFYDSDDEAEGLDENAIQFVENDRSTNFVSLSINSFKYINQVLHAFSKIRSIKELKIQSSYPITLTNVGWELEKLILQTEIDSYRTYNYDLFLSYSQSLKVLKLTDSIDLSDISISLFPNLECLIITYLPSHFLDKSNKLKELRILAVSGDFIYWENIFEYCKLIETLQFCLYYKEYDFSLIIHELPNIKHLLLSGLSSINILMSTKMINLKTLEIAENEDIYKLNLIPYESLKNLETLTIEEVPKMRHFLNALKECHSLRQLNIGFIGKYNIISSKIINQALDCIPNLKCIGYVRSPEQKESHEDILAKIINNNGLVLKEYETFESMTGILNSFNSFN